MTSVTSQDYCMQSHLGTSHSFYLAFDDFASRLLCSWSALVERDEQPYWPRQKATQSMKVNFFVSAVSVLFLKLIYYRAGMVVHLLLLKFSMLCFKVV